MKGSDIKDIAIGVAILAGLYYAYRLFAGAGQIVQSVTDEAKKASGYFFNTDPNASSSFGTDAYDFLTRAAPPAQEINEAQAIKSCQLVLDQKGYVTGAICQSLLDQGKIVKR